MTTIERGRTGHTQTAPQLVLQRLDEHEAFSATVRLAVDVLNGISRNTKLTFNSYSERGEALVVSNGKFDSLGEQSRGILYQHGLKVMETRHDVAGNKTLFLIATATVQEYETELERREPGGFVKFETLLREA